MKYSQIQKITSYVSAATVGAGLGVVVACGLGQMPILIEVSQGKDSISLKVDSRKHQTTSDFCIAQETVDG